VILRRRELLDLQWRDVDLELGEICISGSAAAIARRRIEGTTKSGQLAPLASTPKLRTCFRIIASTGPRSGKKPLP
jgi:hypothetical protein